MQKKFDFKLWCIFLLMTSSILLKAIYHQDGYLTPDSMNYLRLAQNMLDGNGLFVTDLLEGEKRKLFAIWPAGYSFLIFLVAKITFLNVFWASKVLNILTIALIFLLLKKLFKQKAFAYGAIFLISPFAELFSYTWSETVFMFGLIWFTLSIFNFHVNKDHLSLLTITAAALLLFLTRYIGAFAVGIIGLLAIYFIFKKEFKHAAKLIGAAIFLSVVIVAYLYNNYLHTGFATGMPRIESPESTSELFSMLYKAQLVEFNPFVIYPFHINSNFQLYIFLILLGILLMFLVVHVNYSTKEGSRATTNQSKSVKRSAMTNGQLEITKQTNHNSKRYKYLWLYFAINGLIYWLAIVFMRWTSHFDNFNFRLLGPATLLLTIALLAFIQFNIQRNRVYFIGFTTLFLLAFMYNSNEQLIPQMKNNITYQETIDTIVEKYQFLPSESIIVFANRHIDYLRTDVSNIRPYFTPYFAYQETMEQFLERLEKNHASTTSAIYIEVDQNLSRYYFHESIHTFMEEHRDEQFVKIK